MKHQLELLFMLVNYAYCPPLLSGSLLILLLFRSIHTPKQWTVAKVPEAKTLEQNPILHLIKVVDISWRVHNVWGNRLCFCWNATTFELNPFLNPKKSSESLLEPLSKIMCIMVSILSFYIIRSEMLNYCFHGNSGHWNDRLFLVSTSL
jgi:hypothetical protein